MSDEQTTEEQARALGWRPLDEFKGNPDNFVDAETFLERGEKTLPMLQSDRRRLLAKVQELEHRDLQREEEVKSIRANVGELVKTSVAEARQKADADVKELRKQLIEARRSGDTEAELEVEEKLETAREERNRLRDEPTEKEPATKPNGSQPQINPEARQAMNDFVAENSWYNTDSMLAAAANAAVYEIMRTPEAKGMTPKQVLDKAAEQVRERFGIEPQEKPRRQQKVESSGPTVVRRGGGRGFADLPSEAKATAMRQEPRFVGPGKAFKTSEEWKKHYAENFDWRDDT